MPSLAQYFKIYLLPTQITVYIIACKRNFFQKNAL